MKRIKRTVEKKDVLWLILLRLAIIISLLISAVIIQSATSLFLLLESYYYLVFVSFVLSLLYAVWYWWGKFPYAQVVVQIFIDVLLITALVYITGGTVISTHVLYVFSIIAASLILSKRAAYLTAGLAAIIFGMLVDGLYFGLIPYFSPDQQRELSLGEVLYAIFLAWGVFFLVAVMANYLSGNLRKTRQELWLARKELEIKERLVEAGRISAQLAHEIKNPLTAISGSVQVLKNELRLEKEQAGLMDIVLKESERVTLSIDQFLDLAAPAKQAFSYVNLSQVLRETLIILQKGGELSADIRLSGNYQTSNVRFFGNGSQFKQIYWNLLKNAGRAMPKGGTLSVDFFERNGLVVLRFADTGVGMAREEKERMFEPFQFGFENGRGLGLSVVRRIVDDYGGEIRIDSEEDKGTKIEVLLPVRMKKHGRPPLHY